MKLTVLCLFAALTAGAQSTTQHVPVTDIEKTADALRAGPQFITDDATILDCRPKRAANLSGRRTALLDGLSTSLGLGLPTCIRVHFASGGTAGFQPRWAERHARDAFARRQSY